jgi:hypothetical protein
MFNKAHTSCSRPHKLAASNAVVCTQETTNIARKFMSVLDCLTTAWLQPHGGFSVFTLAPLQVERAMAQHRSQYVW